ncbi:MAG: DUF1667 domain-containing protein [Clostridia bacterium]|nr:DUF1667 domain-containing protein [Clostridia bacterium]
MVRELTCIICPMGCGISVTSENGKITGISGNTCPRGEAYAREECTNPVRTVTTTVLSTDGRPVPVKTEHPIPKSKVLDCMKQLDSVRVKLPVKIGDCICEDVFGSRIISSANCG